MEKKDLSNMAKTHNSSERDILNRYDQQSLGKIFKMFGKGNGHNDLRMDYFLRMRQGTDL